ncbi:MAG: phytanoyl-CoA dioxygenase family protein [Pseudomonadales bacterium]
MDINEYQTADLAGKYKSTAGTQQAADPALLERLLGQVKRDGYVVVENLIAKSKIDEIKEVSLAHFEHDSGRNNFEGFATQRLYSMMRYTDVVNPLVEHPLVLGLLDKVFEPNYLLSQLQVINILPKEAAQPLHFDDAFYPWPRPRRALGAATIFAIDGFTGENGATRVIPKSHLWDDRVPTLEDEARLAIPAVMPAGSMLFFLGTLWHGGGENKSNRPRMCATAQYCAPFCRQQENFSLSIPLQQVRSFSENIQRLLGYSIHPPFMGFVGGVHPKRVLEEPDA